MKWVESWFISYALLGLAAAGMMPILLPLLVGRMGGASNIGFVMAAFSLGGLTAPVWGGLSDRYRLHQFLLIGGLLVTAAGAVAFSFSSMLFARTGLALLSGIGLAAASTVAYLFIVQGHPQAEWDVRIGWLQTFYGGGQVIGLLLAGMIGQNDPEKGLLIAGVITLVAIPPAILGTRRLPALPNLLRPLFQRSAHHGEWPVGSPQHLYHYLNFAALRKLFASLRTAFSLFLISWLFSFGGSAAFFSFYPVLMQAEYGVSPGRSSAAYALAAAIGLILYAPAGKWSGSKGPLLILRRALWLRFGAFISLIVLAFTQVPARGWLAMLSFLVVVLAWSLLSVSSSALVAYLSPENEGEGMGIFNAVTAFSGVIGAALGGWAAGLWGYIAIPFMGVVGVTLGFLMIKSKRFDFNPAMREREVRE